MQEPRRGVPRVQPANVERVALVSVHTCPLDQPGLGDSGGMNVYVRSVARRLAEMGIAVDIFTRWAGPEQHVVDVDRDPSCGSEFRHHAAARGFRSFVAVPMVRSGDAFGMIAVSRAQPGGFSAAEIASSYLPAL